MLHIALQEGFKDDVVSVKVNGDEVYRNEHVKTRTQIGYADSFELELQEGLHEVEVALPERKLERKMVMPVSNTVYLGVTISVSTSAIVFRIEDTPFGYL